jgi:hypothetical protein
LNEHPKRRKIYPADCPKGVRSVRLLSDSAGAIVHPRQLFSHASGLRSATARAAKQSAGARPHLAKHFSVFTNFVSRVILNDVKESFFSRRRPVPAGCRGEGDFATVIRLGVPPFKRRCFLDKA